MTKILSRSPRRRLELHRLVLERDGWRCQLCGSMQHLQVHTSNFGAILAATRNRT